MSEASFQALAVPCSCSSSPPHLPDCQEDFLFPTLDSSCVQRPEDLPFSLQLPLQLFHKGELQQACRACLGQASHRPAPQLQRCREAQGKLVQLGSGGATDSGSAASELINLQELADQPSTGLGFRSLDLGAADSTCSR